MVVLIIGPNVLLFHFQKMVNFPFFCMIFYPKLGLQICPLNFGILGKVQIMNGFSMCIPPRSLVILGIQFSREILGTQFCALQIGAQV